MRVEAQVKNWRVTVSQLTTFASVSSNSIAPDLSRKRPFSLYLDLEKYNVDETTKAVWLYTCCICFAQKVKPVPLSNGSTPDARLNWRRSTIAWARPMPGCRNESLIPEFFHPR